MGVVAFRNESSRLVVQPLRGQVVRLRDLANGLFECLVPGVDAYVDVLGGPVALVRECEAGAADDMELRERALLVQPFGEFVEEHPDVRSRQCPVPHDLKISESSRNVVASQQSGFQGSSPPRESRSEGWMGVPWRVKAPGQYSAASHWR